MLVNPAVYADFVPLAGKNRWHHFRIQQGAHCRNEERRGNVLTVEHRQNARKAIHRTVHPARNILRAELTARKRHVALSTSKLSATATRAPWGHCFGFNRRPTPRCVY